MKISVDDTVTVESFKVSFGFPPLPFFNSDSFLRRHPHLLLPSFVGYFTATMVVPWIKLSFMPVSPCSGLALQTVTEV